MGGFQPGHRLRPRDGRERVEKLVERVIPFEIVDQVAKRHPGPDKHGRATQNVRIAMNRYCGAWHASPSLDELPQYTRLQYRRPTALGMIATR